MTTDPTRDVMAALREATGPAHARLEAALGLLNDAPCRSRFVVFLERLLGFHASLEPALLHQQGCAAFFRPRQRVGLLEADLIALGHRRADLQALPRCAAAGTLAGSDAAATGALYVLEGSTLGGRVIARALAGASWLPQGGLRSFDPYGEHTGMHWRDFGTFARGMQAKTGAAPILRGAHACFALLTEWLRPAFRT